MKMTYGSVCSGIEAATVAWQQLGWSATWFAQFDPSHNYNRGVDFASKVLSHHYPDTPNLGDMTRIVDYLRFGDVLAPDILVGGTPCQAFSVAGLRGGLSDSRGQLSLKFVELSNTIDEVRQDDGLEPAIIVWENVPGVLNTSDNAFGCFIAALSGHGEELHPPAVRGKRVKWPDAGCVIGPARTVAWRVLDAQYFGLAQRRRRVFVVASARERLHPARVLFEFDGVRRDTPPSREAGEEVTGTLTAGAQSGGGFSTDFNCTGGLQVVGTLTANTGGLTRPAGNANELDFCIPAIMAHGQGGAEISVGCSPTLTCNHEAPIAFTSTLAFDSRQDCVSSDQVFGSLGASSPQAQAVCVNAPPDIQVRRLTPMECERLQGFSDGYTNIPVRGKDAPDTSRYRALGNSMAVPVMRWIGKRIELALSSPWEDFE